jgi:hypothetical protein
MVMLGLRVAVGRPAESARVGAAVGAAAKLRSRCDRKECP